MKMQDYGFVMVPRHLFRAFLEKLDDEKLAQLGREVMPGLLKEMAEWWQQDSTPEGMLRYLGLRGRPYSDDVQTTTVKEGGTYTIVHRHNYGPRWSILIRSAFQELVRKSFHAEPQISVGESVVTARFKVEGHETK
jgi:hypothetical protein